MTKKLDYEYVKRKIEEKDCFLLEKEYINQDNKMKILFSCGHIYKKSYNKFKIGKNKCPKCLGVEEYSFEEVKQIFFDSGFYLISDDYFNCKENLIFKDEEDYFYKMSFDRFNTNVIKRGNPPSKWKNEYATYNFSNFLEREYDCLKIINGEEWKGNDAPISLCDNFGYKYYISPLQIFAYVKRGIAKPPPICDSPNKYSTENLKNWLKINKKDFSLIDNENYSSARGKLLFRCHNHDEEYLFSACWTDIQSGKVCPICSYSKGESKISTFLDYHKIEYISQHSFPDCKNILNLLFDFYLEKYNLCIEYNGGQHYKPVKFFGGIESFKLQAKRDEIKRKYCEENNINLLIIPYWDYDNIENILEECLFHRRRK